MRHCRLRQVEEGSDVGVEGTVPVLVRNLLKRLVGHLVGSVADQDVDAPQLLHRRCDEITAMLGLGDITLDQASLAAGFLHVALDLLGVRVLAEVRDQDIGTLPGVRDRYGPSDPGVRASDHRYLALELSRALVAFLAAVRDGSHLALNAGYVLLLCWLAHRALLSVDSLLAGVPTHRLSDPGFAHESAIRCRRFGGRCQDQLRMPGVRPPSAAVLVEAIRCPPAQSGDRIRDPSTRWAHPLCGLPTLDGLGRRGRSRQQLRCQVEYGRCQRREQGIDAPTNPG